MFSGEGSLFGSLKSCEDSCTYGPLLAAPGSLDKVGDVNERDAVSSLPESPPARHVLAAKEQLPRASVTAPNRVLIHSAKMHRVPTMCWALTELG